jgi:hypothetical protein
MKYATAIAMSAAALLVGGCASTSKVVLNEPIGPCNGMAIQGTGSGYVQVYSAREPVPIDLNMETYFYNNDFGRNDFLYAPAHTDYTVFDSEGKLFKHVSNARNLYDGNPAVVKLPAGRYTVQAEAEEPGLTTVTMVIPLMVLSGQTTAVHLEPAWKRPGELEHPDQVVALADRRIIGCRGEEVIGQQTKSDVVAAHNPNPLPTP